MGNLCVILFRTCACEGGKNFAKTGMPANDTTAPHAHDRRTRPARPPAEPNTVISHTREFTIWVSRRRPRAVRPAHYQGCETFGGLVERRAADVVPPPP